MADIERRSDTLKTYIGLVTNKETTMYKAVRADGGIAILYNGKRVDFIPDWQL